MIIQMFPLTQWHCCGVLKVKGNPSSGSGFAFLWEQAGNVLAVFLPLYVRYAGRHLLLTVVLYTMRNRDKSDRQVDVGVMDSEVRHVSRLNYLSVRFRVSLYFKGHFNVINFFFFTFQYLCCYTFHCLLLHNVLSRIR